MGAGEVVVRARSNDSGRARVRAGAELSLAILVVLGHNVWQVLPNEVPVLFVLGWISLRFRGQGWRSIGFVRPRRWRRTLLWAAAIAVTLQGLGLLVLDPLLERVFQRGADLSGLRPLVGNPKLALLALVVIWTFAAFGEELVYRGYLMDRAADLGGRTPRAWTISLLLVAVLFGLGHFYKGAPGMVDSAVSGLVLGTAYLRSGRNLWLPILIHGLSDTIALLLVVAGRVPGLAQ